MKKRTPGDPYPRIRFSQDKAKQFGDWLYEKNYDFILTKKINNIKHFMK